MTYRLASSLVERALPRLPYAAAHGHLSVGLKIHCLGDGSHFSALVEGVLHELRSPAAETGLRYYVPLGKILAPFLPKLAKKRASSILRGFQEREMTRASARELKRVGALITSCGLGSSSR